MSRTLVVSPEDSVHHDYIICLFDGEKRKMIARYVKSKYKMEWEEYKRECGLPDDYPSVAPSMSGNWSRYASGTLGGRGD